MNISTMKTIDKCHYTSLIPEPPHLNMATFFVASIIEKGEGDIIFYSKDNTKTKAVHVSENSVVIIPPFVATEHQNFKKDSFIQRNIHIDEATFKECCDMVDPSLFETFLFSEFPPSFKLTSSTAIYLAEVCTLITGEQAKQFDGIHKTATCVLLSSYISNKVKNNVFPVWIRQLIRKLEDVSFSTLTISEMVKTTNYSHGYVNREFKKYLGIPLKQYVLRNKLDLAASFLVTTNLTTQEIVDTLNFSNISNFINCFKNRFNITPAKYRARNSSNISLDDYQEWGVSVLNDGRNKIV